MKIMANLILASEYVSKNTGANMWHVYATRDGKKVANTVDGEAAVKNEFYFYEPLKALRFAFLLRKRLEGSFLIPKGVYNKLLAAVKAAKEAAQPKPEVSEAAAEDPQPAPEAPSVADEMPNAAAMEYEQMKQKHSDAILLQRYGDFYTAFGDDAVAVSEILGLVLTMSKYREPFKRQCSFPAHALDSYLPRLVRAGKRVAICDGWVEQHKPEAKKRSRKSTKKAENK